jgi:hypothetical protein
VSHLGFTVLLSLLLSAAVALMGNRSLKERLYVATYVMLCYAVLTVGGSWAMFLIHG